MTEDQEEKQTTKPATKSRKEQLLQVWSATRVFALAVLNWLRHALRRAWEISLRIWKHERVVRLRERSSAIGSSTWASLKLRMPAARRSLWRVARYSAALAILALTVLLGGRVALHAVEPGEVGVRYSKWGGGGVDAKDFAPGLHFNIPGLHKWHDLPVGTELMTWRSDKDKDAGNQLDLRTLDGSSVDVDLSVPFQIQPGAAHLIVAAGHRGTYRQLARAKAEPVLLDAMGRLSSEDFSSTDARSAVLGQALIELNQTLAEIYVVAGEILIEEVRFSDAYEKKVLETQRELQRGRVLEAMQAQDEEHTTILKRRHEMDEELQARRIELDREIEALTAQGLLAAGERQRSMQKFENERKADADREYQQRVAQGESAVAQAKELERGLRAEILSGGGAEEYLAIQTARATRIEQVLLNSNDPRVPNPLDLSQMLKLFSAVE